MKKVGIYWIDKNGNKWSRDLYTRNTAQKFSETLENCTGCINCSNCCSCSYCEGCQQCRHCYACKACKNCEFSDHLKFCCEVRYSHSCKKTMFTYCCRGLVDCAQMSFVRNLKGGMEMQAAFNGLIEGKAVQMVLCKEPNKIQCIYDGGSEILSEIGLANRFRSISEKAVSCVDKLAYLLRQERETDGSKKS